MISSTLQETTLWRRLLSRFQRPSSLILRDLFRHFYCLLLVALVLLSGCDANDPGEEGGIIGTGIILRGTTSTPRTILADAVDIKSSNGERSRALFGSGNRFLTDNAAGAGPWVLRAEVIAGVFLYGISFGDISNINSYSDVILRNWFAQRGLDPDLAFDSNGAFEALPSQSDFDQEADNLFALYGLLLETNAVDGDSLLNGDFAADGQGIDQFLQLNPVVIEDNLVSVLITDLDRNTQSITRSNLSLGTDFGRTDNLAPSVPGSVRALGSATDEIILLWDPSTDDVSVQGYRVFRDGLLIASTPYPVFTDRGLMPNQEAFYELAAFDAAGNQSARSQSVSGSALAATDTQPPPAPVALAAVDVSSQRIELIWGQSDIADVAAFNMYRGNDETDLQLLFTVTDTFASDTTISGSATYCYQGAAVDASGNESERSGVICVDVGEDGMLSMSGTGGSADFPFYQELNLPDPDTVACERTLGPTDVESSITLPVDCYLVTEDLSLPPFTNLTLQAGTMLKFASDVMLEVGPDASLNSSGTLDAPVVFTGQQSGRGFWDGIRFSFSDSPMNLLRNTVVQYAGSADELEAAVVIRSAATNVSRIRIENSLIRFSGNSGLSFPGNSTVIESFFGNRVTGNAIAGIFTLDLLEAIAVTTDYSGNDLDQISTIRNSFSKDIVIPDPGVVIRSAGMTINNASLTLGAGLDLIMDANSEIRVDGSFSAVGTIDNPITLAARLPGSGGWQGIRLSGRGAKQIDHVMILDAGSAGEGNGAIRLECTDLMPASLEIANTDISGSLSHGIALSDNGCTIDVGPNVTFFNNLLGDFN